MMVYFVYMQAVEIKIIFKLQRQRFLENVAKTTTNIFHPNILVAYNNKEFSLVSSAF